MQGKILIVLTLIFVSCSDTPDIAQTEEKSAGELEKMGVVSNLTVWDVKKIAIEALNNLTVTDPEGTIVTPFQLTYPVIAAKLNYYTNNKDDDLVTASGVIIAPVGSEQFPLLMIQHGMTAHRNNVASSYVNTLGTSPGFTPELITGLLTASKGYITLLPDYLGLGESQEYHPFCHRELTASAVVDMLRAVEPELPGLNIKSSGKRFLFGHSQGGYSSIAALDLLEREYESLEVTACAASAGPYSLSNMVEEVSKQDQLIDNVYAPYLFFSIIVNGETGSVEEIFNKSLVDIIPSCFDGSKTSLELRFTLPDNQSELFNTEFITSVGAGSGIGAKYLDEIASHDLLDLSPSTMINLYYGENDIHIPGDLNALKADSAWRENGTPDNSVNVIKLSGTDHFTSFAPALLHAMDWFAEM